MQDYVIRPRYRCKRIIEAGSLSTVRWAIRQVAKAKYFNVKTVGMERKPRDDSFVEVFNHATCADGPVAGAYENHWLPHFWIQKSDPEKRMPPARRMWYSFMIWMTGQIGVRAVFEEGKVKSGNKEAMKRSIQYLRAFGKDSICVFSEGPTMVTREYAKKGQKPPLYRGAAHISLITGKPIVSGGIHVDVPEELKPVILERTEENVKIMKAYVREHGKINYRISYGDPLYARDVSSHSCKFVTKNLGKPIRTEKVYFEKRKDLEEMLIKEAMDRCYTLAEPGNIEGRLWN